MSENICLTSIRESTKDQHLYFLDDKCQYIKNGKRNDKIYYKCKVSDCPRRGTLVKNVFYVRNEHSNHNTHETDFEIESLKAEIKESVKNKSYSIEKCVVECLKK